MALIAIESADLVFAIDSIPAVLAVTRDPFLVYSSNIFALLGLRALYGVIGDLFTRFRYLRVGLAALLGFVALKLVLSDVVHIPPAVSLGDHRLHPRRRRARFAPAAAPRGRRPPGASVCTHLDQIRVVEPTGDACLECVASGRRLDAPAHVHDLRPRRLLRRLEEQARHRALRGHRPPGDPLDREGRDAGAGATSTGWTSENRRDRGPMKQELASVASPPAMRASGRVYFWQGGSLWIGRGQGRHRDGTTTTPTRSPCRSPARAGFARDENDDWTGFAGAFVPSQRPHQFEMEDLEEVAQLFVEPETAEGRALARRFPAAKVCALAEADRAALIDARWAPTGRMSRCHGDDRRRPSRGRSACRRSSVGNRARSAHRKKPRLHPCPRPRCGHALGRRGVGRAVPSRFRHLFVRETGAAFRPYVLWLRLNVAIECSMPEAARGPRPRTRRGLPTPPTSRAPSSACSA